MGEIGSDEVRVLFLVGARRSGTNWLQRLLCLHPDLIGIPAETYLFHTLAELAQRFHHGLVGSANTGATYLPREEMIASFRELTDRAFGAQLASAGTGKILVERTPWHARNLDLISEVYPHAPLVHLIRDGREVAASLLRQGWGPSTAADAAAEWVETVSSARACTSPYYLEVRHEEVRREPVETMRRLYTAIGLDPSPEVLERVAQTAGRLVNTDREAAQTQSWRRDLSADDIRDIEAVAGPLLTELGYSDDASSAEPAEPPTPTSRRGGSGLLGRLDSLRRRHGDDNNAFSRGDTAQWSVDRFMEAVADRDAMKASQLLSPDVEVSFPGSGEVLAGGDLVVLAQRLIDRLDVRGRQLRGDCFGGEATFTMFCTHDTGDQLVHRVFAANVAPNGSIESMSCYEIRGELR